MTYTWLLLSVAGIGALHGLNPASGWMFAAASGVHSRDRTQALRALIPIALGHLASVALVAGGAALGLSTDRTVLQILAGALLVLVALLHLSGHLRRLTRLPAGHGGLALWSFMMTTANGAGLMFVPALFSLCLGNVSGREITASGSLMLMFTALIVHTAAMLAVTGAIAAGVSSGYIAAAGWAQKRGNQAPL